MTEQPVIVYTMHKGNVFVAFNDEAQVVGVGRSLKESLEYKTHEKVSFDFPSFVLRQGSVVDKMDNCIRVVGLDNYLKDRIPVNISGYSDIFILVDRVNHNRVVLFSLDKQYPNLEPIIVQCSADSYKESLDQCVNEYLFQWHKKTHSSVKPEKTIKLSSWWTRYFNKLDTIANDKILW